MNQLLLGNGHTARKAVWRERQEEDEEEWAFETRSVERLLGILLAIFKVVLAKLLRLVT
jgi:hypothetical protein